jgi:hypothetical protein
MNGTWRSERYEPAQPFNTNPTCKRADHSSPRLRFGLVCKGRELFACVPIAHVHFFMLAMLLLGVTGRAAAEEYRQKVGPAELRLEVPHLENGSIEMRLADAILLAVHVEGESGLEVEAPSKLVASSDWEVYLASPPQKTSDQRGRGSWTRRSRLEPVRPGDLSLAIVPLRIRATPGAEWKEIAWQPIAVHVTSEVDRADRGELRDVTPPEDLPTMPGWRPPRGWLVALGVLVALAAGTCALRTHLRRERTLPPDQWALQELEKLARGNLESELQIAQSYNRVSEIVRAYLKLQFHLPAPEQTTTEFLTAVEPSLLPADRRTAVGELLQQCDLVKFAGVTPSPAECRAVIDMARSFVEQSRELHAESEDAGLPAPAGRPRETGGNGN